MPNYHPKHYPRLRYSKRCKVCIFMKKHRDFRVRVYESTRFNPEGAETLTDVCNAYPEGPSVPAVYDHIKKNHLDIDPEHHQAMYEQRLIAKQQERAQELLERPEGFKPGITVELEDKEPYIKALDDYIEYGAQQVRMRKLKITPNSFIAAINAKAAINKGNKDRTADFVKALAAMAAPKGNK